MKKIKLVAFLIVIIIISFNISTSGQEVNFLGFTEEDGQFVATIRYEDISETIDIGDVIFGYELVDIELNQIVLEKYDKTYPIKIGQSFNKMFNFKLDNKQQTDTANANTVQVSKTININTASFERLREIIHIDEVRAQEIIQLREERPFDTVDELTRVNGIAKLRLADIKDQGLASVND